MLTILGLLCSLVSFACAVIILIHAFKAGTQQGVMCLCIPFYILYYAFTKFEHEKKNMILGAWLGAVVLSVIVNVIAAKQATDAAMEAAGAMGAPAQE
jgi:benzodiazapine receptor